MTSKVESTKLGKQALKQALWMDSLKSRSTRFTTSEKCICHHDRAFIYVLALCDLTHYRRKLDLRYGISLGNHGYWFRYIAGLWAYDEYVTNVVNGPRKRDWLVHYLDANGDLPLICDACYGSKGMIEDLLRDAEGRWRGL